MIFFLGGGFGSGWGGGGVGLGGQGGCEQRNKVFVKIQKKKLSGGGGGRGRVEGGGPIRGVRVGEVGLQGLRKVGDVGYGGCKPRIKGIDKCK